MPIRAGLSHTIHGQLLAQDHILPAPYVDIMQQHALGACPTSPYASVADVLRGDLGGDPDALFARFDREPLASASLAQVHRAVTHGGESVAVKVQHRNLAESAPADIATIRCATACHTRPLGPVWH